MKLFLITVILVVSQMTFAAVNMFDLEMSLTVDGKLISSPHITVQEGKPGLITQEANGEKSFIEVTATEKKSAHGQNVVYMSFVVGNFDNNGQRTVISKPQISAAYDQKAQITVRGSQKPEALSLTVIAKKPKL